MSRDDQWDSWRDAEREPGPRNSRRPALSASGTVRSQFAKPEPEPSWLVILKKAGVL